MYGPSAAALLKLAEDPSHSSVFFFLLVMLFLAAGYAGATSAALLKTVSPTGVKRRWAPVALLPIWKQLLSGRKSHLQEGERLNLLLTHLKKPSGA